MADCPYCGWDAPTLNDEIAHMRSAHPEVIKERLIGIAAVDYRTEPDLPSTMTLGELRLVHMFAERYAAEQDLGEEAYVSILVRDLGPDEENLPAQWVEFSVGERHFAFWRRTMDLYEVDQDGAVGDDPIHRND